MSKPFIFDIRVAIRMALAAVVLCVAALPGCSGSRGEPTYPVSGTLKLDGKPLSRGTVMFRSIPPDTSTKSYTARGLVRKDGTFRLTTFEENDGAVAGRHSAAVIVPSGMPTEPGEARKARIPLAIPPKYTSPSTSGLEYEVRPGPNQIDIDLSSAK